MQLTDRARRALFGVPICFEKPAAMSAVIVESGSACGVFRPKAMSSRVETDVCQYFGQQELFKHLARWAQQTNWATVLTDVVVLARFF